MGYGSAQRVPVPSAQLSAPPYTAAMALDVRLLPGDEILTVSAKVNSRGLNEGQRRYSLFPTAIKRAFRQCTLTFLSIHIHPLSVTVYTASATPPLRDTLCIAHRRAIGGEKRRRN